MPGADPGEVKWVNFHPPFSEPPSFFFFLSLKYWPQTPQPSFGSITLLQKFTPHFKILDPRLVAYQCLQSLTLGEALGKCPVASSTGRCHAGLIDTCNIDKECPSGSYCCFDGCRRKCLDPNDDAASAQGINSAFLLRWWKVSLNQLKRTAPFCQSIIRFHLYTPLCIVLGGDKKGKCPIVVLQGLCLSGLDECFIDWDCTGNHKCCSNGCHRVCVSPSAGLGAAVGSLQLQAAAGTRIFQDSSGHFLRTFQGKQNDPYVL